MRAISLFSGAGGLDLGLHKAGVETVLQAERDEWALQVLARHWPSVERVTDVRSVGGSADFDRANSGRPPRQGSARAIDLLHGGPPCQDYSVAGNRAGLAGDRGALWWEFVRVVRAVQPRWILFENVAGILSSAGGRDWATIVSSLDELGYVGAWRICDARYFGVPQRRRRVFCVAERGAGDPSGPAAVLALTEGCGGHPAPGRTTGQDVAASLTAGSHRPGSNPPGRRHEDDINLVTDSVGTWDPLQVTSRANRTGFTPGISQTLHARGLSLAHALTAHPSPRLDGETDTFVVANPIVASDGRRRMTGPEATYIVANPITASAGHHGHSSPRGDGADNLIAFHATQDPISDVVVPALGGTSLMGVQSPSMGVRRLTPLECERLMGWPDDWTRWTADGREIPDSHRYRLCGNGVVAPVAQWIGHRLLAVDALRQQERRAA